MVEREHGGSPTAKRRKLDRDAAGNMTDSTPPSSQEAGKGLNRPISPPPARRLRSRTPTPSTPRIEADAHGPHPKPTPGPSAAASTSSRICLDDSKTTKYISSPFKLTKIQDLAAHQNVDAVGLGDILGDPMIRECWNFNFLFDVDFVM